MSNISPQPAGPRRVVRPAVVVRSEQISPTFRRVVVGGPDLASFQPGRPAAHIKIALPTGSGGLPLVRNGGGWGFPAPPEGAPPGPPAGVTMRTYTPRSWDADVGELTIDFAMHPQPGPAARWAAEARPGDVCAIAGPGGGYDIDPAADPLVVIGDETAVPAIAMIVEAVPAGVPVVAIAEVPDLADAAVLPAGTHVLARTGGEQTGELMAAALAGLGGTLSTARVFVAGEAALIRTLRGWLLTDPGLPPAHVVTRGYWRRGASNHPDHDYGD